MTVTRRRFVLTSQAELPGQGHPDRRRTLAVSCLGVFLLVVALTALNVALPEIAGDFDAEIDDLQWIVDSYAVVFAGLLLAGGALGDRIGRRAALILGFAIFAAGNGFGATAGSVNVMIIARVIAGLGAAIMMPATLSAISEVFNNQDRGRAIALWASLAGAGGAFGPAIGGWLITISGWQAVFVLNAALAVLGLVGARVWVPVLPGQRTGRFDIIGTVLSVAAVGCLVYVAIEGPGHPLAVTTISAVIGSFVFIAAFIAHERRTPDPLLPLSLFDDRDRVAGAGTLVIAAIGFNGVLFVAALLLQIGWQETALVTGLLLVPIGVIEVIVANTCMPLSERFGVSNVITFGLVIMAVGYVGMGLVPEGNRPVFIVAGLVAGAGNGLAIPLSVDRVVGEVEPAFAGSAASLNDMSIELGASIGVGVLGAIQRIVFEAQLDEGQSTLVSDIASDESRSAFRAASNAGLFFAAGAMIVGIFVARRTRSGPEPVATVAGTQS
ncbi:MAG: MFS transporter [Acidimicrobiaceae bacterium]|jgi:MFS family permease|nr:MFS transporter [Acidimicrobiaceae bacterium]